MLSHTLLTIQSDRRQDLIDITEKINDIIKQEQIGKGFLVIFVPHTTAAVTINEGADPDVKQDIISTLATLIPKDNNYLHLEGNSDAHIKTSLFGSSEYIIVNEGKMLLGRWQHVFFFEGDGPRTRSVYIQFFKEEE